MIYAGIFVAGLVAFPLIVIALAAPWAYRQIKDISQW